MISYGYRQNYENPCPFARKRDEKQQLGYDSIRQLGSKQGKSQQLGYDSSVEVVIRIIDGVIRIVDAWVRTR